MMKRQNFSKKKMISSENRLEKFFFINENYLKDTEAWTFDDH